MGKLTISMVIFNSYVKLPEGKCLKQKIKGRRKEGREGGRQEGRKGRKRCRSGMAWRYLDPNKVGYIG